LGDAGEDHALGLLQARGYNAQKLAVNAKTYDLKVERDGMTFFVSVKVSREKQHVRLGARRSVLGLARGNFVFAYLPLPGRTIEDFTESPTQLLIIPAEVVQADALAIHDPYWIEKQKDPNIFSVMVKGYGSHHRTMWPRWLNYKDAWHLLP
jgi:hypothetical protein